MNKRSGFVCLGIAMAVALLAWNGTRENNAVVARPEESRPIARGTLEPGAADAFENPGTSETNRRESSRHSNGEVEKQRLHAKNQKQKQLESQIGTLLKLEDDQLMVFAAGLEMPGNRIPVLYPQYLQITRELDALKIQGLGAVHPTVKAKAAEMDAMRKQMDEAIRGLKDAMNAQLAAIR